MKKSLLAVAAMGAFASAAQAQSSVTVYGLMDVGFQGVTTRGPLGTLNGASASTTNFTQTPTSANFTRFSGEGAQSTSRLGLRGTEDLGGGTSAFFTAEFGLNPTDNNLSGNANAGLFNRQSFVGIAQKGIGRAAIGTQYTPIHMAVGRTDPGQQNNMVGSIIYTTNASQGSGQSATSYTVRYNNSLTLMTERMAGFQINAIYSNNNGSSNNTITGLPFNANVASTSTAGTAGIAGTNQLGSGESNNTAWGVGANYVWKKLNVDLAYQGSMQTTFRGGFQPTVSGVPGGSPVIGATVPNVMGTSMGSTQTYAGAVYDFGILKAYASYINTKYQASYNTNIYVQRSGQQLGVRGNWTPKIESWASLGNGSIAAGNGIIAGAAPATQNITAWQVGSNYILSKRTNLYAIFGATQVSSSSVNMSEGATSYGIGARHTF